MANGRTTHMRKSAMTLTAVTKQRRVKIGAIPFDGYTRMDRQPRNRCSSFMWFLSTDFQWGLLYNR